MAEETKIGADMKCPQCGGECKWVADASAKVCAHCGYQENIPDSDEVRIARIAAYKEIELAKMEHKRKRDAAKTEIFQQIWPFLFLVGILVFCLVMSKVS